MSGYQNAANYTPQMATAGNITQYAGGTGAGGLSTNGMNLSGYMNPYINSVVNSQVALENQQDGQQQNQLVGNQVATGAFGGDRATLAQAALGGQQALANNATNSALYQQGFTQAQNTAEADISRQLQAGTAQAQLGLQAQQGNQFAGLQGASLNLQANNQLMNAGTLQQQTAQNAANSIYQNQINQAQFPYQQAQFLDSGVGGLLGLGNHTMTQTTPGPSSISEITGLGTAAAGLGGLLFGGGGGSSGGSGGGLLGAVSSGIGDIGNWLGFKNGGVVGDAPGYAGGGVDGDPLWLNADGTPMSEDQAPWSPSNPGTSNISAPAALAELRANPATMAAVNGTLIPATDRMGTDDGAAAAVPAQPVPVPAQAKTVPVAAANLPAVLTSAAYPDAPAPPVPPSPQGSPPAGVMPQNRLDASAMPNAPMPPSGLGLSADAAAAPPVGLAQQPLGMGGNGTGGGGWALPVLAAGLGMMASRSPFALNGIGEGGLAGLQQFMQDKQLAPQLANQQQQLRGSTMQNDLMQARIYGTGPAAAAIGGSGAVTLPPLVTGSGPNGEVTATDRAAQQSVQSLMNSQQIALRMNDLKGASEIGAQLNQIGQSGQVAIAGGSFAAVPGALRGIAAKAAATAGATAGAQLPYDVAKAVDIKAGTAPIDVATANAIKVGGLQAENAMKPINVGSRTNPVFMTGNQVMQGSDPSALYTNALNSVPENMRGMVIAAAAKAGMPAAAIPAFISGMTQESGFNPSIADGKAGEIGMAQVKPATGADMGYTPQQLRDPLTNLTAGAKYFTQKWQQSNGDPAGAYAGYNSGSVSGTPVPGYLENSLGRLATWGGVNSSATPGLVKQNVPGGGVAFVNNAPMQDKLYQSDLKDADNMSEELQKGQADQSRLLTLRGLIPQIQAGAGGTARAQIANWAQTYLPQGAAQDLLAKMAKLPDAAAAQEFAKLALTESGAQEQSTLGSRGGVRAMEMFQKANPSLDMQGGASTAIINARLVQHQLDNDYIQGAQHWVNQNGQSWMNRQSNYQPLSNYDEQWNAQRNPQVGLAAMQAMNGAPFDKWANKLSQAEGQRALQLIYRADPTATVMGDDGQKWPVTRFMPQQPQQPTQTAQQ